MKTVKIPFERWMVLVNEVVEKKCGLCADDLSEAPYYDWWENGKSATAAANKAVKLSAVRAWKGGGRG